MKRVLRTFWILQFGFAIGFASYAVLDRGHAIIDYLPVAARNPMQRMLATVATGKAPDFKAMQTNYINMMKELIPLDKQLQEAGRRHSGQDQPELKEEE
jgi:hypothetical protein